MNQRKLMVNLKATYQSTTFLVFSLNYCQHVLNIMLQPNDEAS